MITLLDSIITAVDNGKFALGIFLDFSKAFDTVNHSILLSKLEHYGIRGVALNWITSYLTERKQFCTFNKSKSNTELITCGIPQGSILGPLLFLAYINDLGDIFTKLMRVLFADDTNLAISGNSISEIESTTNNELPILLDWLYANRLSLNIKKTQVMLFGGKNNNHSDINILINGEKINVVTESKFLGVTLDSKLNWKTHIQLTAKKVAKSIGILIRARQFLDKKTMKQLYYTFVYPHLIYCITIWGKATAQNIWPLLKLQKLAVRIITN